MTINSDPTSVAFNSYTSVEDADAYLANSLFNSEWTDAEPELKARALISATRRLDTSFIWEGYKTESDQPLEFPRAGIKLDSYLVDNDSIPPKIAQATMELAICLLKENKSAFDSGDRSIDKLAVGSISLSFSDAGSETERIIKVQISALIRQFTSSTSTSGIRQIRITR